MMCVEFRSALMHAAWMHDKTSENGGDECRIFWGWLDAHVIGLQRFTNLNRTLGDAYGMKS